MPPFLRRKRTLRPHSTPAARHRPLCVEWLERRALLASISGLAWNDQNGNGVKEAAEPVTAGVIVYVDANDNGSRDAGESMATTAADGTYSFPSLLAGNYVVREEVPANYDRTFPTLSGARLFATNTSASPDVIVEVNPTTGATIRTIPAPLATGSTTSGLAFDGQTLFFLSNSNDTLYRLNPDTGAVLSSTALASGTYSGLAALGGFLYALDSSAGDLFKLDSATGAVLGTLDANALNSNVALGDALGEVPATGELLVAGNDAVFFISPTTGLITHGLGVPNGFSVHSLASVGSEIFVGYSSRIDVYPRNSAQLSRSITMSFPAPGLGGWGDTGGAHRLSLAAAQVSASIDFGNRVGIAGIAGTIWDDYNSNGVREAGEPLLSGKTVYLDANDNRVRDAGESMATTAADGSYSFPGLFAGNYVVREELPANYSLSVPRSAGLFAFDTSPSSSTTSDRIVELNRFTGEVQRTFNAPVSSGSATAGLAFDGQTLFYISGSNDQLYRLNPNTGEQLGVPKQLTPKNYGGLAVLGGFLYAVDGTGDDIFKFNPTTGAMLATMHVNGIIDALGEVPSTGELVSANSSGLVFINPATGAITRSIPLASATSIKALTAIGNEIYVGYDTTPNRVDVLNQSGVVQRTFTPSPLAVAGLGGWSDPTAGHYVSLATGQAVVADFGNQLLQTRLLGTLWDDLDGDGARDAGEPPRSGAIVYLDSNDNRMLDVAERWTTTAADGSYALIDVPTGSQIVRQNGSVNFAQSFPMWTIDRLFATDIFEDRIFELDPATAEVLNSFPLPGDSSIYNGLAFDGRVLYYSDNISDTLFEVNPTTGAILDSTILPDGAWNGLAAIGGLIYLQDSNSKLAVFDPVSNLLLRTFVLVGFPMGFLNDGLGEISGPDRLIGTGLLGEFLEIDPLTGATVTTFNYGDPPSLGGYTSIGQQIFVGDSGDGKINVLSRSGTLLRTMQSDLEVFGLGAGRARTDGAYRFDLRAGETIPLLDFANRQNAAPTDIALAFTSIPEIVGVIGKVTVSDPDPSEFFTYSVNDSRFDVVNDLLVMKNGQSVDFETATSITLTITATDTGGLQVTRPFTLAVTNVNEPVTDIALVGNTVAENAAGAVIGLVSASGDPEGNAQTFTVSDTRFQVVSGQFKLKSGQSLNFESAATINLTITATDSGGAQFSEPFTVTVTNVNEAPTNITLSPSSVAENAVAAAIGTATVTDPDAGDTRTLAVNDSRFEFVGTQLRLRSGQSLDRETESSVSLTITATDAGGLSFSKAVTVTVTNVNEAPTNIALSANTLAENAVAAAVGTLTATDPDVGNTHTFTVNDSRFEVVSGQLKLKAANSLNFEFEPSIALTVTAQDAGGLTFSKPFTLTVTNVNEAPTGASLSGSSVVENDVAAAIGFVNVVDPDSGEAHLFAAGDSRFEFVGNALRLKPGLSLNFEAEPSVSLTVTVTDAGGLPFSKSFTIAVTNVNESPTDISLSGGSLAENSVAGVVGAVTVTDPDAGNAHSFAVSDSRFEIDLNLLKLKAGQSLDFETEPSVNLTITATDQGGLPFARPFTLTVTNVNETPTDMALANSSVAENAVGAVVGAVAVIDPDAGDTHSFVVSDNRFEVVLGQLKLKPGQSLDFEADPSVNLTITAQDLGGLPVDKPITLTVTNVNEQPTGVLLVGSTVAESAAGATIGSVMAADPDAGDTFTYFVSDSRFEIVAGQLQLKATQSLDFESEPSVNLTITVEDAGGLQLAKVFVLSVTDVNEQPTDVALVGSSVAENAAGAAIGTVTAADPDAGDMHTFLVSDSRFEIVGNQLRLKALQNLDFELEPSVNLTITAQDAGGLQMVRSFVLTVTNVNEPPTNIDFSASTVAENAAGVTIGNVSIADVDLGDTHSVAVSDPRFEVVLGVLRLKAGQSLDFETQPIVALDLTAQDAGGLTITAAFTIQVSDVNDPPASIGVSNHDVPERSSGAIVADLMAIDQDAGQSVVFTISDSRLEVVGSVLKLKAGEFVDRTLAATVSIDITATDDGSPPRALTQSVVLNVLANPFPWQNSAEPLDATNDAEHAVVPIDALVIFNLLNSPGAFLDASGKLPASRPAGSSDPFYDTSGDGYATALDALLIINELNAEGEGETAPRAADRVAALDRVLASLAADVSFIPQALRRRAARR